MNSSTNSVTVRVGMMSSGRFIAMTTLMIFSVTAGVCAALTLIAAAI